MLTEQFDAILNRRIAAIQSTLASKAKEYAKGDRLYNFKRAGTLQCTSPEKALLGMLSKHLISMFDLIEGTLAPTDAMIDEKLGDVVNYVILLEALLREKLVDRCSSPS